MRLGTGRYRAELVSRPVRPGGARGSVRVDLGPQLNVTWGMVDSRTSEGSVTIPGDCSPDVETMARGLVAVELWIWRLLDGGTRRVWRGPLIRAQKQRSRFLDDNGRRSQLVLTAADPSWWQQGRIVDVSFPAKLEWDPAELAAALWDAGKAKDPWDEEEAVVTPAGRVYRPEVALSSRYVAEWLEGLNGIRWRVVDGVFEVAGRGRWAGSYLGIAKTPLVIKASDADWRDDVDWLIDATRLSTLLRMSRRQDALFGGIQTANWGYDFQSLEGSYDASGIHPIWGLLETVGVAEDGAGNLSEIARAAFLERSTPDDIRTPSAALDPMSGYDLGAWLPGVEVELTTAETSSLFVVNEVAVQGIGVSGDATGAIPEVADDAEQVRVLLSAARRPS